MTTLLINGRIHSPSYPDATAFAVRDGVVAWLGSDDVGRSQFPDAEIVDLDGGFVAPAFVDSHVHLTATGLNLDGLDLRGATSLSHCLRLVDEYARRHPDGLVWGTAGTSRVGPTKPHCARPTWTAYWGPDGLSGSGRCAFGRRHHRATPVGARADRGRRVRSAAPSERRGASPGACGRAGAADPRQRHAARVAALDHAAAMGIAAVHECAGPQIGGLLDWQELRALEHGVEVVGYWGEPAQDAEHARHLIAETGARGLAGDLFVDGALGSRTAWLHEPYRDAPDTCGNSYLDVGAITTHVQACTEAGIPAGFHVIGDAAVAAVVEGFEAVVKRVGGPAVARCGHRLEHLEMVNAEQAARLGPGV